MENLFIDILELTLPISALIAVLLLFSPLLKHSYVAKWRYYMWLFVAVRLVLPFKINVSAPITIPMEIQTGEASAAAAKSVSVSQILMLIWILGIAVFAAYQVICYISFKRTVKRWSKMITDTEILDVFDEAKRFAGVKRSIEIKQCKVVTTPMVFGLIKPVLLLPDMEFGGGDLPIILRHELVHFKRRDIWKKLLLIIAKTVHWFNPAVYLMFRAANKDIELACDAEVVKNKDSKYRQHYCEAIMRLVHNGCSASTALSTCFIFSKKTIKERFKSILDEKIKRNGVLMFCVVAASVALSGSLITFATEQVAEEIEENLQIVERPVETPKESEPPAEEPAGEAESYTEPEVDYNDGESYEAYQDAPVTVEEPAAAEDTADTAPETVDIGEERGEVYDRLGEPDSVSGDGSKEVYTLDDGSTAILQYEGDTLEEGYILVD